MTLTWMEWKSTDSSLDHTRCLKWCFQKHIINNSWWFPFSSIYPNSHSMPNVTKLWQCQFSVGWKKNIYFSWHKKMVTIWNWNQQQFQIMILYYMKTIHKWIENAQQREKKCFGNDTRRLLMCMQFGAVEQNLNKIWWW